MMMISMIGANTPSVYNKSVKLASAATPAEGENTTTQETATPAANTTTQEAATPVVTTTVTPAVNSANALGGTPITPTPINSIQTNTTDTLTDGDGSTLFNRTTSESTLFNPQQPRIEVNISRTTVINKDTDQMTQTTEIGGKLSTTGSGGSASFGFSDKTTVRDRAIPSKGNAIGYEDEENGVCKLAETTMDGITTEYEAPKPKAGCITGELRLTETNNIKVGGGKVFTQKQPNLPVGVSIKYTSIRDGK
jgi:hypothetical protein